MQQGGNRILLADIGGTNARFALADRNVRLPLLDDSVREFSVVQFSSLADAARHYMQITGAQSRHAVFAVAGRVDGDQARITNHPWLISREQTRLALGLDSLQLVNDFSAQAMALPLLRKQDIVLIGTPGWKGMPDQGDRSWAVIGPGTGLGVGALLQRNGHLHALQSEGGHSGFSPGTPEEIAILQHLSGIHGRVSNERVLSGMGLVNLQHALCAIDGDALADDGPRLQPWDIRARAQAGDARCLRAIELFCGLLGAAAGDLVLTLGAWDGVLLTGGLVPRLLPWLRISQFRDRFEQKGRFTEAMAQVPALSVIHPQPGLLGAAAIAIATD